jgi:hypothetical protein
MNENLSTLEGPLSVADEYEFELPPLFAGIIAKEYQCGSTNRGLPMRGWGASEQSTSVEHKGRKYMATPHRHEGVPGLRIQIDDLTAGDRVTYWVGWDQLDTITVVMRGLVKL